MLDLVGLAGKEDRFPDELSGGEQQRVAIARAFVNRPMILIADEPTGNLDPATSVGIMRLLDRINRTGTTVVMATHDAAIVDQMRKRVIELEARPGRPRPVPRRVRGRPMTGTAQAAARAPAPSRQGPGMRLRFVLGEVGIGLRRNLTMTIAVVITVAVSLALFGAGLMVRSQVDLMKDYWYDKVQVSIFLCGNDLARCISCAAGPGDAGAARGDPRRPRVAQAAGAGGLLRVLRGGLRAVLRAVQGRPDPGQHHPRPDARVLPGEARRTRPSTTWSPARSSGAPGVDSVNDQRARARQALRDPQRVPDRRPGHRRR